MEIKKIALIGNQNCGKTTLFNALTGSNQHIGNFPGVTVEQKTGYIKNNEQYELIDLPGIYSLTPYSLDEVVSVQFLLNDKPHFIINIVDATHLERNLYLTLQLMELNIPMILVLNMMDEIKTSGTIIHIEKLKKQLIQWIRKKERYFSDILHSINEENYFCSFCLFLCLQRLLKI